MNPHSKHQVMGKNLAKTGSSKGDPTKKHSGGANQLQHLKVGQKVNPGGAPRIQDHGDKYDAAAARTQSIGQLQGPPTHSADGRVAVGPGSMPPGNAGPLSPSQ